jgi:hypothetical protein
VLDKASSEEEIIDALEAAANEDVRSLFFDLINLIRAGDLAGAEVRLNLRTGEASPRLMRAGSRWKVEAASSEANSDQVMLIDDILKEELDRLLDP